MMAVKKVAEKFVMPIIASMIPLFKDFIHIIINILKYNISIFGSTILESISAS